MSTFSGLNTAWSGLYINQMSMNTVGHNISNSSTDGYSRQTANQGSATPEVTYGANGKMQVGTGVEVESITRARNSYADYQFWKESSSLGYSQTAQSNLSQIESVFNDPTTDGFQKAITNFVGAWNSLGKNANDPTVRANVLQYGEAMVNAVQQAASRLTNLVDSINSDVETSVTTVNRTTSQIAALNVEIVRTEANGNDHANDLRDKRDLLVDQLSKIINISVSEDNTGAYTVQTSGAVLVNGRYSNEIAVAKSKDLDYGYQVDNIIVAGTNQELNFGSGSLKAKLDSRDSTETGAKGYLNKLSSISQFFLQDFNEVHRSGYGTDNTTGNNFFGNTTAQYVDPATGAINTSDPYTWTSGTAHSPTKGDWIRALTVNTQLTSAASGVDKIASKTLATVTQSRPAGGALTFGGSYTGATNTAYTFRIDSVAGGDVATASYSTDGGTTYTAATINTTTKPPTATLNNGLTVQIATNASNTALDTYSFTPIQNNGAGDNAVLLYNRLTADLSTTANTLSNSSFQSYYTTMIGTLGIQSQDAQRQSANQKVVVDNIDSMRQSTSGVSTDQEMTDMIMFQKGYNAAARILTTMDSMLDTLINSTGRVGR